MLYDVIKMWFDKVYTMWMYECLVDPNSEPTDPIKTKLISNVNEDT